MGGFLLIDQEGMSPATQLGSKKKAIRAEKQKKLLKVTKNEEQTGHEWSIQLLLAVKDC